MTTVITGGSIVRDNLEQVQNRSNATGNTAKDFEEKEQTNKIKIVNIWLLLFILGYNR